MDKVPISLHTRLLQLENLFLELTKEIKTTVMFTNCIQHKSEKMVQRLTNTSLPSTFLKEYIQVNSFLMKYLNILTEINCKFEMLQILENTNWNNQTQSNLIFDENEQTGYINSSRTYTNVVQKDSFKVDKTLTEASEVNKLTSYSWKFSTSLESEDKDNIAEQIRNFDLERVNLIKIDSYSKGDFDFVSQKQFYKTSLSDDSDVKLNDFETSLESQNGNVTLQTNQSAQTLSCVPVKQSSHDITLCEDNKNDESQNISTSSAPSVLNEKKLTSSFPVVQINSTVISNEAISALKQGQPNLSKFCENEIENNIKPLSFSDKLGDEIEVIVQHINSPSEFYIYLKGNEIKVKEMEHKLKLFPACNKKEVDVKHLKTKLLLSKELGDLVLHYSKCDEVWCRAKVIDWRLNNKNDVVNIFLIDYGESKFVSIDTLQQLPEFLKKYPAFAIRCHLQGVYPVDMKENNDSLNWGSETSEQMRCFIDDSEKAFIKLAQLDQYHLPTSLPVILYIFKKTGIKCVNDLLVQCKYATLRVNNDIKDKDMSFTYPCEKEKKENFENWNPMKDDYESYNNSYDLDINDPAAHIYGYIGKDYNRICRHYLKHGKCFKGDACKMEHTYLDPLGYTKDKEEVYKNAFNSLHSPAINEKLNVQVTCVLSLNQFSCIPENFMKNVDEENLFTLLKFMNSHENRREMRKLLIPPSLGQVVIAQYSEDNSWYRAKILDSQPEKDLYTVLFVDYGNKEILPLSRIRAIEAKYLHLPFQAMHCFIFGIKKNPEVSYNEALEYLSDKLNENQISIQVISKFPGDGVILSVKVFDRNGIDIGKDLIDKQYALHKEEVIANPDLDVLPG